MNQLSLFDQSNHDGTVTIKPKKKPVPKTRTHKSHGETSRMAADKLDLSDAKERHMFIAQSIVYEYPGSTAYEIDELAVRLWDLRPEQARKRLADVENKWGSIWSDEKQKRRCREKKGAKPCKTWWPVAKESGNSTEVER